jgi:hypothetical protein
MGIRVLRRAYLKLLTSATNTHEQQEQVCVRGKACKKLVCGCKHKHEKPLLALQVLT